MVRLVYCVCMLWLIGCWGGDEVGIVCCLLLVGMVGFGILVVVVCWCCVLYVV